LCQVGLHDSWVDDSQATTNYTTTTTPQQQQQQQQASITKTDLTFYHPDDNDGDDDDETEHLQQHPSEDTPHKKSDHNNSNNPLDLMAMCDDDDELDDSTHSNTSNHLGGIKRIQIKLEQTDLDTHPPTTTPPPPPPPPPPEDCSDSEMTPLANLDHHATTTTAHFLTEEEEDGGGLILLGLSGGEGSHEFAHPGPSHQSQAAPPPSSPPPTTSSASHPSPDPLAMTHRPTPPRKMRRYSKQDLATALNLIREGHLGIKPAARAFNIPVATLYNAAKRNDIISPMQQGANKESTRNKMSPLLVSGDDGQQTYLCFSHTNTSTTQ
ncbi:hypothetical protein Pcinc_035413, partial [Petrolisthes cinctipes]